MSIRQDVRDEEITLDEVQRPFDPTRNSTEPDDWDAAVDAAPAVVVGGGGTDNSAAVNLMVRIARGELGVCESPPGSNAGPPLTRYVRYFQAGLGPLPWCAFFVSWAWDQASDQNRRVPWGNPGYVGSVRGWAGKVGRLVSTPIHGDLFGVGDNHMGIVVGSDPRKRILYTTEGNYSGKVAGVSRPWGGLWFARLA